MSIILIINIGIILYALLYFYPEHKQEKENHYYHSFRTTAFSLASTWKMFLSTRYIEGNQKHLKSGLWLYLMLTIGAGFLEMAFAVKAVLIVLLVIMPFIIIDLRAYQIEREIDQALFGFMARLSAQLIYKQDFIEALKSVEHKVKCKFIHSGLRRFNAAIRAGLTPETAFGNLLAQTHHRYLRYLYVNIEQSYLRRGDVVSLMSALEEEFTSVQVERNKRKIELYHYRNATLFGIGFVVLSAVLIIQHERQFLNYYLKYPFYCIVLGLGFSIGLYDVFSAQRLGRES